MPLFLLCHADCVGVRDLFLNDVWNPNTSRCRGTATTSIGDNTTAVTTWVAATSAAVAWVTASIAAGVATSIASGVTASANRSLFPVTLIAADSSHLLNGNAFADSSGA